MSEIKNPINLLEYCISGMEENTNGERSFRNDHIKRMDRYFLYKDTFSPKIGEAYDFKNREIRHLTEEKELYKYTNDGESEYSQAILEKYQGPIDDRRYTMYEDPDLYDKVYAVPDDGHVSPYTNSLTNGKGIYDFTHDKKSKYSAEQIDGYYINDILEKSYGYKELSIDVYTSPKDRNTVMFPQSLTDGKGIYDFTHDGKTKYSESINAINFNGITKDSVYETVGLDNVNCVRWRGNNKEYITLSVSKEGKLNNDIGRDTKIGHNGYDGSQNAKQQAIGSALYRQLSTFYNNSKYYVSTNRSVDGRSITILGGEFDGIDSSGKPTNNVTVNATVGGRSIYQGKRIYTVYGESDIKTSAGYARNGELNEFGSYRGIIRGKNNLLKKTEEMYLNHRIGTLFGRFHTSDDDGYNEYNESFDSAKIPRFGNPRGRGLFKLGITGANAMYDTNGYDNPYCRSWSYHHQMSKVSDLMRSFKSKGEEDGKKTYRDISIKYRSRIHNMDDGGEYLKKGSVLQESGFVRITPSVSELVTKYDPEKSEFVDGAFKENMNLKKYMFSIENLAWSDGTSNNLRNLSMEQLGPNNGRIMWFPPYNLDFKESVNVKWNSHEFIGRGENVYTYSNTTRKGTLSFTLLIDHPSILNSMANGKYSGEEPDNDPEGDILRFFAGCQIPDPDKDVNGVIPDPDVRGVKPKEESKPVVPISVPQEENIPQPGRSPERVGNAKGNNEPVRTSDENTEKKVVFYTFFPNNYSGMWNGGENLEGMERDDAEKGYEIFKKQAPIDKDWYEYLLYGRNCVVFNKRENKEAPEVLIECDGSNNILLDKELKYIIFPDDEEVFRNKVYYTTDGTVENDDPNSFNRLVKLLYPEIEKEKENPRTIRKIKDDILSKIYKLYKEAEDSLAGEVDYEGYKFINEVYYTEKVNEDVITCYGFEMDKKSGISYDVVGDEYIIPRNGPGEDADFYTTLNTEAGKNLLDKKNRFEYRVDYDLRQAIPPGSMTDKNSYQLNSNIENVKNYTNDVEVNYTFSEVFTVIYGITHNSFQLNDDKGKRQSEDGGRYKKIDPFYDYLKRSTCYDSANPDDSLERMNFLEILFSDNDYKISGIETFGGATGQDGNNSKMLSKRRRITVAKTIEEVIGREDIYEDDTDSIERHQVNDYTGEGAGGIGAKIGRYAKVIIKYNRAQDDTDGTDVQVRTEIKPSIDNSGSADYNRSSDGNNGYNRGNGNANRVTHEVVNVVNDIDEMSAYDSSIRRYDDEYRFFRRLKADSPLVYKKIVDKVKYFNPAFHSMSPEGFNARLTFLHQCTRQGHTISASENNYNTSLAATAGNLSFGKMPVCVLRIGDFINTRIIIESITIDYKNGDSMQWDLNPEGAGVQPMFANVSMGIYIIGGQSLEGPINRLQNAVTFNYYANAPVYDDRADRVVRDDNGEMKYTHLFTPFNKGEY